MGLDIVVEESERLSNMVEELLDFSRIASNKLQLYCKEFDICNLLKKVIYQLKYKAEKKNINIDIDLLDDEIIVKADENRIKQVIINIFDNAIKFTNPDGNIKIQISLKENTIKIQISDDGMGMSAEDVIKVKQKFVKGRNTGENKGLGLGLAISDEIIKCHKGDLSIESENNKGTKVTISLPRNV
jgi:signal transduction histidine kinase